MNNLFERRTKAELCVVVLMMMIFGFSLNLLVSKELF